MAQFLKMHFSVFLLQKIKYFKLHHILFSRLVAEGQKRAEQEGKLERTTFMFAKYKYIIHIIRQKGMFPTEMKKTKTLI